MKRQTTGLTIWAASGLLAVGAVITSGIFAQPVPKPQDKLALGESEVKQLLLLMDTDKNGKISKQEYMAFMGKEFDRLDKDQSGELDPKELTQSSFRVARPFSAVGK